MTYEQGKELVSLAREKGLLIGCAPDTFLGGRLQNIRELIDSGKLGRSTARQTSRICSSFSRVHERLLINIETIASSMPEIWLR